MGEAKKHCFNLSFTDKVKAYFKGSEITSDGGLIAIRELDEKMGLTSLTEDYLVEIQIPMIPPPRSDSKRHPIPFYCATSFRTIPPG